MRDSSSTLADTHCHLVFADSDLGGVLSRAHIAGVDPILVPGVDLATSRKAVKLAEREPSLYAAVGVHPGYADQWGTGALAELRALASSPSVVAIGEIGLDYYRDRHPKEIQLRAFRAQLDLAAELGLPVVVHNREAIHDLLKDLETWSASLPPGREGRSGCLHAFSGDASAARRAISAGFYLGVAGPVTFHNAKSFRETTSRLPLGRLVLETDSPYLTPHPYRGQRNEPAHLQLVAEALSELLEVSYCSLASTTSSNATELFGWEDGAYDRSLL